MKNIFILMIVILFSMSSCEKNSNFQHLDVENSLYEGVFKFLNSGNTGGTINLKISNSHYDCSTNFPFGHGAGKVVVNEDNINFIDTLFFPIPALYGPSHVLSGEYQIKKQNDLLIIWRKYGDTTIQYELKEN